MMRRASIDSFGNSFAMVPGWVYAHAEMTPTILSLYVALAMGAERRKPKSIPSLQEITGLRKTAIYEAIAVLLAFGAVVQQEDGRLFIPVDPGGQPAAVPLSATAESSPPLSATAESHSASTETLSATAESHLSYREPIEEPKQDLVSMVFDAWVESTGKTGRTKLTGDRRGRIVRYLRDYPVEDLMDACRGWAKHPHYRGENDRNEIYNDLDICLRDAKHIELFRDLQRGLIPPPLSTRTPATNGRTKPMGDTNMETLGTWLDQRRGAAQ